VPRTFVRPCNPVSARNVPAGDAWLHEPKLDGYRLQMIKEGGQVRLYSRRGEWTRRLPGLADELAGLHCRSAVIDAELCLPGAGGVPDFYGLHLRMRRRRSELDLLHRDGRDLRALPLTERRRRLERLVEWSEMPCLRLVEAFADGGRLLKVAEQHRLEGVVSKEGVRLPLGPKPRLAQDQNGGLARGQPRTLAPVRRRAVMRRKKSS
jgi:bifunctional non-homologous end joining protein LigD